MLQRWTLFILRRRWFVLGAWIATLMLSWAAASRLSGLLTNHFSLPGTDSQRAERILESSFGQRTVGSFTLVAKTSGNAEALVPAVEAAALRAVARLPTGKLAGVAAIGDKVVGARIVSSLKSADANEHTEAMRAAIGTVPGAQTWLTGFAATEHDLAPILQADLWKGEVLIAIPIAIVLLVWTFGTMSFVLPLVLALFTISTTLGLVFVFANLMELTSYVTNLVGLVGLGIAIDYSLLMVHRFRDEVGIGASTEAAIVRTMDTAGRAVIFSGTAVAIGLALLVLLPVPFLRGFGVGGLLIPTVSVLAALSLLPVLLSLVGRPLERFRLVPRRWLADRAAIDRGFWPGFARAIMRRPVLFATSASIILLLMAAPLLDIELGPGSNDGLPASLESVRGLAVLSVAAGAGAAAPSVVVIDAGRVGAVAAADVVSAIDRLAARLKDDPQVAAVYFAADLPGFVDVSRRYANLLIVGKEDFGTPASLAFVDRLRTQHIPAAAFPASATVVAGGTPPAGRDFLGLVRHWFPWLVAAILAATFLLLLRAFRSLVLPLKAIVLNLLSIGAAYGLTVAAFSWGWGAPFGLISHSQVDAWIPVMVFAMLFGLSMDYEVFLVCRMREHWDRGVSNEEAVIAGLATTGRLVTSAGLIMCAAFSGFVAGRVVELQQFGFALATAVLVDVTIVRAVLLPASMKLFGRWNWYLPAALSRILRA